MAKKEEEYGELCCGCIILFGIIGLIIYNLVIYWYITLPTIVVVIGIVVSIYKIKNRGRLKFGKSVKNYSEAIDWDKYNIDILDWDKIKQENITKKIWS